MINVVNNVPSIYRKSRDFQVFLRLYTALFNSCKYYSDCVNFINGLQCDDLGDLLARTANFVTRHSWDNDVLKPVSECFKYITRRKGTTVAIKECINILLRLYNLPTDNDHMLLTSEQLDNMINSGSAWSLDSYMVSNYYIIMIPKSLSTIGIVLDLLDYVLPIGVSYRIIETLTLTNSLKSYIQASDKSTQSKITYLTNDLINAGAGVTGVKASSDPLTELDSIDGTIFRTSVIDSEEANNN